jgi:hypothetical protein
VTLPFAQSTFAPPEGADVDVGFEASAPPPDAPGDAEALHAAARTLAARIMAPTRLVRIVNGSSLGARAT